MLCKASGLQESQWQARLVGLATVGRAELAEMLNAERATGVRGMFVLCRRAVRPGALKVVGAWGCCAGGLLPWLHSMGVQVCAWGGAANVANL